MEQEKKFTYTLILATCIVISGVLLFYSVFVQPVPLHNPQTPVQVASVSPTAVTSEAQTVDVTAQDLQLLLQDTASLLTQGNVGVSIAPDGTVALLLELPRAQVVSWLQIPAFTEKLLPEICSLSITCSVGVHAQEQQVVIEPTALSVNGLDLTAVLVQPITNQLALLLQNQFEAQQILPIAVCAQQGQLIFEIAPNPT